MVVSYMAIDVKMVVSCMATHVMILSSSIFRCCMGNLETDCKTNKINHFYGKECHTGKLNQH